jgi:hypothetical protein
MPNQATPNMDINRLQELKQQLLKEKDLSTIWTYYMDNFADHAEFTDLGEPKQSHFLEALVPQVCQQLFGKKVKIHDLLLIYLSDYQFFHAPFVVEHRIGGLIYFEDVNTGLIAVSAEYPMVKYSRFTGIPKPSTPQFYDYN